MFSTAEKQAATGDKAQELGPLGLSSDDFKAVLAILKNRSECLFLRQGQVRPLITDRTTQNSLLGLLGPKKKSEFAGGGEVKKSSYKNNLKNKLDAEEAAIKNVYQIMASTLPSQDNPLKDVIMPINPWSARHENELEYLFREGVCLDIRYNNVIYGRYLSVEDTGSSPFALKIRFEIRILQCLLLNFSWFINRLYKLIKELNVESRAVATSIVFSDAVNSGWANMTVDHHIRQENIPAALKYIRSEYPSVYSKINFNEIKPTYFVVEFQTVDNAIGLADSDMEHMGMACVQWKCFNIIRKNAGDEFGINNFLHRRCGTDNVLFEENVASSSISDTTAEKINNNAETNDSEMFDATEDNLSWMRRIMEVDINDGEGSAAEFEKLRSGTSTVTISQSSSVSLAVMAKGNESKILVDSMIKFIDQAIETIDNFYMHSEDYVFSEDQGKNYELYKFLYLAAICSNPSNIYRVACHLFCNLLLPRLRNPISETRQINSISLGNGRSKVTIEYGCGDMQYGTPQYAKGKVKISATRLCECRKMCKESHCFDSNRLANTLRNGGSNPDPAEKRRHNSHRSSAYDFRFFDKIEDTARKTSNRKLSTEINHTLKHDFLAQDRKAFDLLNKCFPSAGLHHIYCPDVLMVYRGNNFNIDLKNNKLDCITESNQCEEITSSQTVNTKEALIDINGSKLRKGADIVEHLKSLGISLREYSYITSSVVRDLNDLTNKLCNTFSAINATNLSATVKAILAYVKRAMPMLETIFSFVDIKELRKPFDELKACESNNTRIYLKASFAVFRAIVKFMLRNYNASVSAAINQRGYLTNTATLTGYRFNSDGNVIYYHETIAAVSSCVAYADYFSSRPNVTENRTMNIDGTVTSLMADFSDNCSSESNTKIYGDDSEAFMKMFAGELLGEDNDVGEETHFPSSEMELMSLKRPLIDEEGSAGKRCKVEEEEYIY